MNIPKLRFPGFVGEWEEKRFNEIFRFISTNSITRENLNYDGGVVRNIHYGDIHKKFNSLFDINKEDVPFINADEKLSNISKDDYCIEGDVIFADASEDLTDVGKSIEIIFTNDTKLVAGLHTIHARKIVDSLVTGFAGFLMKTTKTRSKIMFIAQGTKVSSISPKHLGSITINFPSLEEQQKIATFLSSVDNVIQLLTKKKTLLENYKKGIMQKIFSQEIRFKDEVGKDFPDWEEKRLGEVAEIIGGGTPDTTVDEFWNGEIVWLTPTEIKQKYITTSIRKITESALKQSSAKLLPKGTILFTSRATIGDVGIAKTECTTNQGFQSFIAKDFCNNEFLYYLIIYNKQVFVNKASGSTFLEVSKTEIVKISFPIPSLPEQQKISDFLSGIDRTIEIVNSQVEKTKEYKKGLLQQMFV